MAASVASAAVGGGTAVPIRRRCVLPSRLPSLLLLVALLASTAEAFKAKYVKGGSTGLIRVGGHAAGARPIPTTLKVTVKDAPVLGEIIDFLAVFERPLNGSSPAEVTGVKFNSSGDFMAMLSAIYFNCGCCLLLVALFVVARWCFPDVYACCVRDNAGSGSAGKTCALPAPHDSWFGWINAAICIRDDQVIAAAGLDGLMLLEFHGLLMKLLCITGPVVMGVLCPIHYYFGEKEDELSTEIDFLSMLDIGRLLHGTRLTACVSLRLFWIHAATVWFVVLLGERLISSAHHRFLEFRFSWLRALPDPRATTLMVENIPKQWRSEPELKRYFVHLFSEQAVDTAYIVRHTARLRRLVSRMEVAKSSLKLAEEQWDKVNRDPRKAPMISGWIPWASKRQNAIEFYKRLVEERTAAVKEERWRVNDAAAGGDSAVCSKAGFVSFTTRSWCRLASREQFSFDENRFVVSMPPDPSDVNYQSLEQHPARKTISNLIACICNILIFVASMPVVVLISGVTTYPALEKHVPVVKPLAERFPWTETLLQGILATIALKLVMMMLPTLLIFIINTFDTPKSDMWAQNSLQKRYYMFEVVFVVLVTAINQSLLRTLRLIVDQPGAVLHILAEYLPNASHFYLNYMILGWLTVSLELTRYPNLAKYLCVRALSGRDRARRLSEPEDKDYYGMGARMSRAALMATISIVFCTCVPLISFFAWVYFSIGMLVYSYLLVFAETKKPDLGGIFWVTSLQHLMFALCLFVTLMVGIFSLQQEARHPAIATATALLFLFYRWKRLNQLRWEALPFEDVVGLDHSDKQTETTTITTAEVDKFIQPECVSDCEEGSAGGEELTGPRRPV